jgi:O-antigen/teichoic acid export membrane protein
LRQNKISNVKALQLFQLVRYGALLLIGILLSKSELGKTNIGQYETFLLIAGAFTFFWVNGFIKVMMPMSSEKEDKDKPVLIFNIFVLLMGFSLIAAILVYFINQPFAALLLNGNEVPMPALLSLYILLNSPALLIEYIYLINNRSRNIITYGLIIFGLQVIIVGLPSLFGYGLETIITGLTGVAIIKFIWLLFVLHRYSKAKPKPQLLQEFIRYGSPLVLSTLLSSSASYIDGFIITSQFSPDDFAVFQYGARELPLALLLCNSLSMASLSHLAKDKIDSPLTEFRSEVYRLHWYLFPISIVLLLLSHWLFPIVFNPQFEQSATIFNIYLLLVISRLLFPQTLLTAKKINSVIVRASFFELLINVGLSLWFASTMGIKGVAYATFIAYVFEKVYLIFACKKRLNISPVKYIPLKIYFISSSLLAAVFIIVEFILY